MSRPNVPHMYMRIFKGPSSKRVEHYYPIMSKNTIVSVLTMIIGTNTRKCKPEAKVSDRETQAHKLPPRRLAEDWRGI